MRCLLTIIFVLVPGLLVSAQTPKCKSPIEYGNRNQVNPTRSTVRGLSGRVISEVGDPAREIGPVPACLGLFTETDHRLVASAVANQEGRFRFGVVRSGRFRLVVRDPLNSFCLANMPLHVVKWPRRKTKPLVIHMRPAGIDDCSYGDFK
jgi:hypothetical protein